MYVYICSNLQIKYKGESERTHSSLSQVKTSFCAFSVVQTLQMSMNQSVCGNDGEDSLSHL